mgnify:CR=1 FL=1
MRANQIKEFLKKGLKEEGFPSVFIWGAPGVGKSSIIRQVAEEMGIGFIKFDLLISDPCDLRGIPRTDEKTGRTRWCPPYSLPDIKRDGERGVFFLDDFPTADPAVQKVGFQLLLEKRLGDYQLPQGWTIVGAGNRIQDRAGVGKMLTPIANRLVHLTYDVDLEEWKSWAYQNGIDERVISFLNFRPSLLLDFDPKKDTLAFPSPRSWEFLSKILKVSQDIELIQGCVGEGAGVEFVSFLKCYQNLPDTDKILEDPLYPKKLPESVSTMYALVGGLVEKLKSQKNDKQKVENVVKFSIRLQKEFAVLLIKDLIKIGVDVFNVQSFDSFVKEHGEVIL